VEKKMSYIGKNPEADSVKLKGSATEPSGTAVDGQVYFNTGAGSISKGMKVYKNSQFVAIDKQLGDADTMQLLKAADIPAIDFNLSLYFYYCRWAGRSSLRVFYWRF
jgi:hypothetical protein